jgi:DNA-binding CsgD family transcriptional regulator
MNRLGTVTPEEAYICYIAVQFGDPRKKELIRLWSEGLPLDLSNPEDDEFAREHYLRFQLYGHLEKVTAAEAQVVALYRHGHFTDKEIAAKLGVSEETVQAHIKSARRKLNAPTRVELLIPTKPRIPVSIYPRI